MVSRSTAGASRLSDAATNARVLVGGVERVTGGSVA
jgi:hypothetical protein